MMCPMLFMSLKKSQMKFLPRILDFFRIYDIMRMLYFHYLERKVFDDMMKIKKIRWGIVGPGTIAKKFAKAIKNVTEAELCAVASRSRERGDAFAQVFDIPEVFGSYEEMAASPDIDAVYIATPHPAHKTCAELFLNAKKHVLCEKPICINANEARQLLACAEKNGVFLMEAMWTKFLPAIREAQRLVAAGEIGEVRAVSADFCYNTEKERCPMLYDNSMAGGSLLDVGVYGINAACFFEGYDVQTVTSYCRVADGVDTHASVILGYESGATAIATSAINVKKPSSAYIYGSNGYLFIPDFYRAQSLVINKKGAETVLRLPSIGEGFEEEIIESCRCIAAGKTQSDIHPMTDSIKVLEIMDTVRAQNGIVYPSER